MKGERLGVKMKFKENLIDIMLRAKAVHCDTVKKAEILLKELAKYGVKWKDGVDLTPSDTKWNLLKNETCYVLTTLMKPHDLAYWTCEDCQMSDYKIVEFDELLDDEPEDEQENDIISHPAHYCHSKYEPKDVIRDWGLNFNLGNVVKYISRAGYKDDIVQDLKKARQYLDFEIEALEEERNN